MKHKHDHKTAELTGIPRVPGRPNLGLTKSHAEYKRAQREVIRADVLEGNFYTRAHCMHVLSNPLKFTLCQRNEAWLKLGHFDNYTHPNDFLFSNPLQDQAIAGSGTDRPSKD